MNIFKITDMINTRDLHQIKEMGISQSNVEKQLQQFKNGFSFINIVAPATVGNGIIKITEEDIEKYKELHKQQLLSKKVVKFVPASGAATRMFKKIFDVVLQKEIDTEKYLELIQDKSVNSFYFVYENIKFFAFFDDLREICEKRGENIDDLLKKQDYITIFNLIISHEGLNYGNLPKGLIKFHKYKNETRTAAEEHLVEGAQYANSNGTVRIHFTVSEQHKKDFNELIKKVCRKYEERFGVKYEIDYSIQDAATDTIAVTTDNLPFRNEKEELLFRPAGHGALLKNLGNLKTDIVFIKNIDNVVTDRIKADTVKYKEIIGGILAEITGTIKTYLEKLEQPSKIDSDTITEMLQFTQTELNNPLPENLLMAEKEEKVIWLQTKLNRPVRVCGMVKNEGEPGGGPFWVEDENRNKSLQIVEISQINMANKKQVQILNKSTHFNPVDIVCQITDYKGKTFDLSKFIDENTGFISQKYSGGVEIKALELPGLWNGSMAHWNTIFVEVPVSTFNPVKTINDLLREEHLYVNDLMKTVKAK